MKTITTTWWIVGLLVVAMVAGLLGLGGQVQGSVAYTISALFGVFFVFGLMFDGLLHLSHSPHRH